MTSISRFLSLSAIFARSASLMRRRELCDSISFFNALISVWCCRCFSECSFSMFSATLMRSSATTGKEKAREMRSGSEGFTGKLALGLQFGYLGMQRVDFPRLRRICSGACTCATRHPFALERTGTQLTLQLTVHSRQFCKFYVVVPLVAVDGFTQCPRPVHPQQLLQRHQPRVQIVADCKLLTKTSQAALAWHRVASLALANSSSSPSNSPPVKNVVDGVFALVSTRGAALPTAAAAGGTALDVADAAGAAASFLAPACTG